MDRMPDETNPSAPNCDQIRRAVGMYSNGITLKDFIESMKSELNNEGMYLAWHAAKAFMIVEEQVLPELLAMKRTKLEEKAEREYQRIMARAEADMRSEKDKGRW